MTSVKASELDAFQVVISQDLETKEDRVMVEIWLSTGEAFYVCMDPELALSLAEDLKVAGETLDGIGEA